MGDASKIDFSKVTSMTRQTYPPMQCRECKKDELYCKCEKMIPVYKNHLLDLLYWARRYCDGRATYAPSNFNQIYKWIAKDNRVLPGDMLDQTLKENGKYWPYAQDGMYDENTGAFDART